MNRDDLEALGVTGTAADAVLTALGEAEAAADAAAREARRLQGEADARVRREAITRALTRQGARPDTVALLALAADTGGEAPLDEERIAATLRETYPALFQPELPTISPPQAPALTPASLDSLSVEEINRNWESVKQMLRSR